MAGRLLVKKIVSIALLMILVTSCTSLKRVGKSQTNLAPAKLAILPMNNYTNDVAGAILLREVIAKRLLENNKGYLVQGIEETDSLLRDLGVTDGGQLSLFSPLELSKALKVDGLIYLRLDEIGLFTLPYYHVRKIDITYKLYSMGLLFKEKPIVVANRFLDIKGILDTIEDPEEGMTNALTGMAIHQGLGVLTGAIAEHEVKPEMGMVANELYHSLPYGNSRDLEYLKGIEASLEKKLQTDIPEEEKTEVKTTEDGIIILN